MHKEVITIHTERLYLRRFLESDALSLYEYLANPEVTKYEPYDIASLSESKEIAKSRSMNPAFFAVCLKENDKLIGNVYFAPEGPEYLKTYTLGYVFNPKYGGNGYATEACLAMLEYGFNTLKLHRIVASCNQENIKSWLLLERLKMRRESNLKKNVYFKTDQNNLPKWVDSYQYAILAEEFIGQNEKKEEK